LSSVADRHGANEKSARIASGDSWCIVSTKVGRGEERKKQSEHVGSSLDEFLKEEGLLEEARTIAIKEAVAWQVQQAMLRDIWPGVILYAVRRHAVGLTPVLCRKIFEN
jgi:hypothetical protein